MQRMGTGGCSAVFNWRFQSVSTLNYIAINKLFIIDGWNRDSHPYRKLEYGKWELILPPKSDGSPAIPHLSELKVTIFFSMIKFVFLKIVNV